MILSVLSVVCVRKKPLAPRIEEDAHVERAGVNTLQVPIEHSLEIIEIAPLSTRRPSIGITLGHAREPPVVHAHGLSEVPPDRVRRARQVAGSNANVRSGVETVPIRRAFLARELHETVFAIGSASVSVAGRFLEGDGGEEDGGEASLSSVIVEIAQIVAAGVEQAVGVVDDRTEVDVFNV